MRHFIKVLCLTVFSFCLVIFASANASYVKIYFLPQEIARFWGMHFAFSLPLFIVIIAAFILGIILGNILLWIYTQNLKHEIKCYKQKISRLQKPDKENQSNTDNNQEDVLTLLENAPKNY